MKNKKLLLILALILVLAILAVLALALGGVLGKKDARSLKIYRLEGQATVERGGEGAMPAELDMALRSGDRIRTEQDGGVYVNMDGSKYVFADSDTAFTLEASGGSRVSSTALTLEKGSLMLHVMNALGSGSDFSVTTPDARFSVRGTSFRVDLNENGTQLYVFDGKVETAPAAGGEPQVFTRGQYVTLRDGAVESVQDEIDYEVLSLESLSFLNLAAEKGKILSISSSQLQEIIAHNGGMLIVKFTVGENVFGTQTVAYGEHAHAPKLQPAPEGDWDYDFSTPITKDTVIPWAV